MIVKLRLKVFKMRSAALCFQLLHHYAFGNTVADTYTLHPTSQLQEAHSQILQQRQSKH